MTNEELIKWLRNWYSPECHTAANRIEELLRDLKSVLAREAETQARHDNKMEELEAKLARAVEGLRYVVSAKGLTDPTEYGYEAIKHARIVLAEIEEETK